MSSCSIIQRNDNSNLNLPFRNKLEYFSVDAAESTSINLTENPTLLVNHSLKPVATSLGKHFGLRSLVALFSKLPVIAVGSFGATNTLLVSARLKTKQFGCISSLVNI